MRTVHFVFNRNRSKNRDAHIYNIVLVLIHWHATNVFSDMWEHHPLHNNSHASTIRRTHAETAQHSTLKTVKRCRRSIQ